METYNITEILDVVFQHGIFYIDGYQVKWTYDPMGCEDGWSSVGF